MDSTLEDSLLPTIPTLFVDDAYERESLEQEIAAEKVDIFESGVDVLHSIRLYLSGPLQALPGG